MVPTPFISSTIIQTYTFLVLSYQLVSSQIPISQANPLVLSLPCNVGYVNCLTSPCSLTTCKNVPNAVCTNNYCGGCNAIFTNPQTGELIPPETCDISQSTAQITNQLPSAPTPTIPPETPKPLPLPSPYCSIGWVYCSPAPCQQYKCTFYPNAFCINNYCGECSATFYDSMNNELTPAQCGGIMSVGSVPITMAPIPITPATTNPPTNQIINTLPNPPPATTRITTTTTTTTTTSPPVFIHNCHLGWVHCDAPPCLISTCNNYPQAICRDNYCGGCNADYYMSGIKLTSDQCGAPIIKITTPSPTIQPPCLQVRVNCLVDPCAVATGCPAFPNAICNSNNCGGCYADYYDNNILIPTQQCQSITIATTAVPQIHTGPFCPAGWVFCSPAPCSVSTCHVRNAICHNNYCGQCRAVWADINDNVLSNHQCGLPSTPNPTIKPTFNPINRPTFNPTLKPSTNPTLKPSTNPTLKPTLNPVVIPTPRPTLNPVQPTPRPTANPIPTPRPTANPIPTPRPTANPIPTPRPTLNPVVIPTPKPTLNPVVIPTPKPTLNPVIIPTPKPTLNPVVIPTPKPTLNPITSKPTVNPVHPTSNPTTPVVPVTIINPILTVAPITTTSAAINPIVPVVTPTTAIPLNPTTAIPTLNPTTCITVGISSICVAEGEVCCGGGVSECLFDNPTNIDMGRCCIKHRKRGCIIDSDCCRYGIDAYCSSGKCKRDRSVPVAAQNVNNKLDNFEIVKDTSGNDYMTISMSGATFIAVLFIVILLIIPFSYWYYNKFVVKKLKKTVRREVLSGLEIVSNDDNEFIDSDSQQYVD